MPAMDLPSEDHFVNGHDLPTPPTNGHPATSHQHIWVVAGPAGCGKSTVAQHIADHLHLPYLEGDDFHSKANVDKMSQNIPLTDSDRWDWLITLRDTAIQTLSGHPSSKQTPSPSSKPSSKPPGVVLTCSALKLKYRDVIRIASLRNSDISVHFVFLHASRDVLMERVTGRKGHYMGAGMVESQLASLEEPLEEETDVVWVDVGGTRKEVEEQTLGKIRSVVGGMVNGDKLL